MHAKALTSYTPDDIQKLVHQIPFFTDLQVTDQQQYDLIIAHTHVHEMDPGELILRKGTIDKYFYSLVKGRVDVFAEVEPGKKAISQLSSGQVLGALGIINNEPRTATLAASNDEGATLIVTDFSILGEINDFSQINLATKLRFFTNVVNNIRWKLEQYKRDTSDPTLAQELKLLKPFSGKKNSVEELEHLAEHASYLGCLLDSWNDAIVPDIILPKKVAAKNADKKGILSSLFGRKK